MSDTLKENEQKLLDMLWALPYNRDPDNEVTNNRSNGIVCTMLQAMEDNKVDEFIEIIESHPDADYDDIMILLTEGYNVEYVDEIDEDDEDFAD